MKKSKFFIAAMMFVLTSLTACSSSVQLTATQEAVVQIAIKTATVRVINQNDNIEATAQEIVNIAQDALQVASESDDISIVDVIDERVRERIVELNLSAEKYILVNSLLTIVKAEISARIDGKTIDETTLVTISGFLQVVIDTAKVYA